MNEKLEIGDVVRTPHGHEGVVTGISDRESGDRNVTLEHDHGNRYTHGEFAESTLQLVSRPEPSKQERKKRLKEVPLPGAPAPTPPNDPTER